MIPQSHQRLAVQFGLNQEENETDDQFIKRIDGLRGFTALRVWLKELGGSFTPDMNIVRVRQEICRLEMAYLQKRGFVEDAEMIIGTEPQRRVKIVKISVSHNPEKPEVRVHCYAITPWEKPNNNGRIHRPARYVLENGQLASKPS